MRKKILRRFAVSVTGAACALGLLAPSAMAGGSGDWYWSRSCAPSSLFAAVLTNYDTSTGQEYHFSMKQYVGLETGWYRWRPYFNSTAWPMYSGSSGTVSDGYQRFSNKNTYVVSFYWRNSNTGATVHCSITG